MRESGCRQTIHDVGEEQRERRPLQRHTPTRHDLCRAMSVTGRYELMPCVIEIVCASASQTSIGEDQNKTAKFVSTTIDQKDEYERGAARVGAVWARAMMDKLSIHLIGVNWLRSSTLHGGSTTVA